LNIKWKNTDFPIEISDDKFTFTHKRFAQGWNTVIKSSTEWDGGEMSVKLKIDFICPKDGSGFVFGISHPECDSKLE